MQWLNYLAGRFPRSWVHTFGNWRGRNRWFRKSTDWISRCFRNREGVIQQGCGRGLRFNTGDSAVGYILGTHEPVVQAALQELLQPGMTFYDIGANVGFTAVIAARLVGPEGKVMCFEPQTSCAALIRNNAALNQLANVTVQEVALGSDEGQATFLVSSFSNFGKLALAGTVEDQQKEVQVQVRRLDNWIKDAPCPKPDLIKIDVEGAEVVVLAGAKQTLEQYKPLLLIELHGTNKEIAQALADEGYEACVLGSNESIEECHWNAHVLGIPSQRPDLAAVMDKLTNPQQNV